MMYTYDFFWYSGARTDFVYAAGDQILLDVYDDPSTPENDVFFRFRNVIDNGYDSSSIVNVFFDTGTGDALPSPMLVDLLVWDQSIGGDLGEPGDIYPSDPYLQFDKIAFSADFSAGRDNGSLPKTLGVNPGEYLIVKGVLGDEWAFDEVVSALSVGMNDTYNDALYWDQLTTAEKTEYRSLASEGLRISIVLHSVVPNSVDPDGHGLFVTDSLVSVMGTPDPNENVVFGTGANDTLNGSTGADKMYGLAGDDTYIVNHSGDVVVEQAGQGRDGVRSSISFALPASVEDLELTGTATISGAGNELDNLVVAGEGDNYLDGKDGKDTLSYANASAAVKVSLAATSAQATGGSGMDTVANFENLTGSAHDDTLTGSTGTNIIDGGAGADSMAGGLGNDTFIVDNPGDLVTDSAGTDTVRSAIGWTLGASLENLVLIGAATINGTGNAINNVLTGNVGNNTLTGLAGNDTLDGGGGVDTLIGGTGNDVYSVDTDADDIVELSGEGTDTVISSVSFTLRSNVEKLALTGLAAVATGNALANTLTGNTADNTLYGLDGNDTLDAGGGIDTLIGGKGNDTYVVDSSDVVVEVAGEGTDTIKISATYTLSDTVENLTLTGSSAIDGTGNAGNNVLTGNGANNTLIGFAGNDTLDGGAGSDIHIGGLGNDTYVVDSASDVVTELAGEGTDTVKSSITYTLADVLEKLTLSGSSAIDGTGNAANNTLTGNTASNTLTGLGGNDTLDGGRGDDVLIGGTGNDNYVVDSAGDVVTELAGEGTDTVSSSVSFTLADTLEHLTLTGSLAINGTGNGGSNTLTGNSYNNQLNGGAGNDVLVGGKGADTLIGGAGADRFDFNYLTDSPVGGARDVISDFSSAQGDKIDLSTLDASTLSSGNQAFTFIGAGYFSFNVPGMVRFDGGVVQGDVNGDGIADFEIALAGVTSLTAGDFIL